MRTNAYQVLADCPACRIEAAVVELVEADDRGATCVESRCRYCGRTVTLGETVAMGVVPRDASAVRAALARWADAEGEPLALFVEANFCGKALPEIEACLVRGESLTTSFDVLGYFFPESGARGVGSVACEPSTCVAPAEDRRLAASSTAARAMAAVMLADGRVRPGERRFLDAFLERAGRAPMAADDLRPWRPADLDVPDDAAPIVEAMLHLMYADRESDETEWRVVREFARHWGVSLVRLDTMRATLDRQHANVARRLFLALRSLFVDAA